eukprot:GHVQ01033242.1.p1 GENE.GHVQ01033242.1~~GHVQ01033242.1.p1  ORF type:complete len:191 (-),score=20.07 GHVQ01033242.1:62-634(-)
MSCHIFLLVAAAAVVSSSVQEVKSLRTSSIQRREVPYQRHGEQAGGGSDKKNLGRMLMPAESFNVLQHEEPVSSFLGDRAGQLRNRLTKGLPRLTSHVPHRHFPLDPDLSSRTQREKISEASYASGFLQTKALPLWDRLKSYFHEFKDWILMRSTKRTTSDIKGKKVMSPTTRTDLTLPKDNKQAGNSRY